MVIEEDSLPLHRLNEDEALRTILEGTATVTGEGFFTALVQTLAKALKTHGAWVTEYFPETRRLRALAFWMDGNWVHNYDVGIAGTPCEQVIETSRLVHFTDNLLALYSENPNVNKIGAVSYVGVPLLDIDGKILGHMAVIDRRPIPEEPRIHTLFRIFAGRAAAELQRLRAEAQVREREEKLGRLVDSVMDAIIEMDQRLCVTRINTAAANVFQCPASRMIGQDFSSFLSEADTSKLMRLITELNTRPEGQQALWIPGGLTARCPGGREFPAEATLSRFHMHRKAFHTLILRNIDERLEAERQIRSLTAQSELLREELQALHQFDDVIGQSPAMMNVLNDVGQVAETDATVLIRGETGTGKEVIARAIHARSRRRQNAFIKVNCAAIPAMLIESELFGHEAGAFTGATKRRDGRFALADRGTIFLDEIGELTPDLEVKLLRVLQEGEFEPVGSSRTRKVDVRVLAATNRDLEQAVRQGQFRQDLYYRVNVFPIHLPPLRERGDDIELLAAEFVARFAKRMGRKIEALSQQEIRRLRAYNWPGNVRELQNVLERALITSQDGRLNLDRALPESAKSTEAEEPSGNKTDGRIRTAKELEELERQNILRALKSTGWRVAGDNGAARVLGMNASTLSSRIKTLGIQRPQLG